MFRDQSEIDELAIRVFSYDDVKEGKAIKNAKKKGIAIGSTIALTLGLGVAALMGGDSDGNSKVSGGEKLGVAPVATVHPDARIFDAPFYAPVPPKIEHTDSLESVVEIEEVGEKEDLDVVEEHIKRLIDIEQSNGMWMPMGSVPVIQEGARPEENIPFAVDNLERFNAEMSEYISNHNLLPEGDGEFEYITNNDGDKVTVVVSGSSISFRGRWVGYGQMHVQVLEDGSVVVSPEVEPNDQAGHDATEWAVLDENGRVTIKAVNKDSSTMWFGYDLASGTWSMTLSAGLDSTDWLEEYYVEN